MAKQTPKEQESNGFAESFTNAQLVQAIKKVVEKKGKKADLIDHLNLEPTDDNKKVVYAAVSRLKQMGVQIPDFKTLRSVKREEVTEDDVAAFNKILG